MASITNFQKYHDLLIYILPICPRHLVVALDTHIIHLLAHFILRSHRVPFASFFNNGQDSMEIYNSILMVFSDRLGEVIDFADQSEGSKDALRKLHQFISSLVFTDRDRDRET